MTILREVLTTVLKDDSSFPKTLEETSEFPSMSGSISTAGNVTSRCDLDSGMKNWSIFCMICLKVKGLQLKSHLKALMEG